MNDNDEGPPVDKLDMHSPDLTQQNIDRIAELFPTVMTERVEGEGESRVVKRAIDFDLLRQELSGHVVEGPQERYRLDWPGKREALFAANAPIAKTLRPVREDSVNFDTTQNLFIEGDNLDVLKLLQKSYLGKVKLIYIDPPYNTGNDFVYDDDFAEDNATYLLRSGQVDGAGGRLVANAESNGRFHSDWLSMIYPRLRLARNLLAEDGAMFVSIGDREHGNLRRVMDEVFGEANFLASIARVTKRSSNNGTHFSPSKDHVLSYARNVATLPGFSSPLSDEQIKGFNREDSKGRYKEIGLYQAALKHGGSTYPIECPDGTLVTPPGSVPWRWSKATFDAGLQSGLIVFKRTDTSPLRNVRTGAQAEWNIYTKLYLDDRMEGGLIPKDFIEDVQNSLASRELKALGIPFDFPKPVALIKRFLDHAATREGIVLDFFGGSGATAEAVLRQNAEDGGSRRFIVVQIDEPCDKNSAAADAGFETVAEIAKERIRRAGAKVVEEAGLAGWELDTGFRALKIDATNMVDLLRTPDGLEQARLPLYTDSIKFDRSHEDLLFQVLLDRGLELTMPIKVEKVDGRNLLTWGEGALIACFDADVTTTVVREIAARKPLGAVFRDAGFATDADRINAQQVFAEVSPGTDVKAI